MVLQAHSEGSSLRGVSRTTKLAYNTVVSLVRRASVKGQMVHNKEVKQIETGQLAGDEFWGSSVIAVVSTKYSVVVKKINTLGR